MENYKAEYKNKSGDTRTITITARNAQQALLKGLKLRETVHRGYDLIQIYKEAPKKAGIPNIGKTVRWNPNEAKEEA